MTSHISASEFGYLIVSEINGLGFCGGLLLVTSAGRPIEFHCTAPVIANRAQQILYGATLKEFLVCDQIGVSLLEKLKQPPNVVLVQDRQLGKLASTVDFPVVLVDQQRPEVHRPESQDPCEDSGHLLEIANQQFEVFGNQADQAEQILRSFAETLPISEPFERIREAINEAHSEAA